MIYIWPQALYVNLFKVVSKKTFTELLIEARINKACKLLSETDYYISEICYTIGFNNLSGFNRAFKKINAYYTRRI